MKPSLFISRRLPDAVLKRARLHFDVTLRDDTSAMRRDEMVAALAKFDAILPTLGDQFSADLFATPPMRARILANFGVGYNHIDVAAAKAAGLVVSNTPGAVTDATADIALTLMLMTARRTGEGERMVRAGNWAGWHPTQMLGLHVSGKTLGVIGMGRIGKAIAARAALGFGMKVVFFNRSHVDNAGVPATQLASIGDVAKAADVVVVALPGGPATRHMIDGQVFAAMKPSAIFVNIARGDIVDQAALITALQMGQIAGAGLDVYEDEPKVPADLIAMENVTLLPHLGTAALDVRIGMGMMALDNLVAFFANETPPNAI